MAFISNGTTILDNGSFQASLGSMVLLSEQTASSSASISFTSGIDSTYPIYKFNFINMHPQNDKVNFEFQGSTNGGSSYGVTITSTFFRTYHTEAGAGGILGYYTGGDLAQSTSFQIIGDDWGNDNDQNLSGEMFLYNPSSDTFVKHFMGKINEVHGDDICWTAFFAGYFNTTSAIDAIKFQSDSGNIDNGTIKLYGIKDS